MEKMYENETNSYSFERHRNALDMNFVYIGGDVYELPANWGGTGLRVDLSASGKEQFQILKTVCFQLISMVKEVKDGI